MNVSNCGVCARILFQSFLLKGYLLHGYSIADVDNCLFVSEHTCCCRLRICVLSVLWLTYMTGVGVYQRAGLSYAAPVFSYHHVVCVGRVMLVSENQPCRCVFDTLCLFTVPTHG